MKKQRLYIKNRKANFNYEVLDKFTAGIILVGSEVKAIFTESCTIGESYCYINSGEVFIKNMNVPMHKNTPEDKQHDPIRVRKLLLNKHEINKIAKELKIKGNTLIPLNLFENEGGKLKLEIAICRGKKEHDKRDSIKKKDIEREIKRDLI